MCGRYVSTASLSELAEAYGVTEVRTESLGERYNVAPSEPIYAVIGRHPRSRPDAAVEGEAVQEGAVPEGAAVPEAVAPGNGPTRRLGTLQWGLVPSWAKDRSIGNKLINARSEGIRSKPAFRSALLRRRCVIPADAFYEWQAQPEHPKRGRLPHAIRRRDGRPLSFAGLWEVWRDPADADAEPLRTATIVTTAANEALADIHSRMPVVLGDGGVDIWLDPDVVDPDVLTGLLVPAPDEGWESWPVSTRVNAVANEGPELLEALAG